MSVPLRIGILILVACIGYGFVGRLVPQKEQHPPPSLDDPDTAPPDELAKVGAEIYPGQCAQCHGAPGAGGTERAPDLSGVPNRNPTGYSSEDYLAESMCDPGAYLAKRDTGDAYGNIMSFKLQPTQILAVLAYLQTLGQEPTDAIRDSWKKYCAGRATEGPAVAKKDVGPPEKIVVTYACGSCHDLEGNTVAGKLAPPLGTIGSRMSAADIFLQIAYPDSQIPKPPPGGPPEWPKGLMKQTLEGNGFYRDMRPEDMYKLALWLFAKKGK